LLPGHIVIPVRFVVYLFFHILIPEFKKDESEQDHVIGHVHAHSDAFGEMLRNDLHQGDFSLTEQLL